MKQVFSIFKYLTISEKARLIVSVCVRVGLVALDLVGVALIGISVSVASGITTTKSSFTGQLQTWIENQGFVNAYAFIASLSVAFFILKALLSILLNRYISNFAANIEIVKAQAAFEGLARGGLTALERWDRSSLSHALLNGFQMGFGSALTATSLVIGEVTLLLAISAYLASAHLTLFILTAFYFALAGGVLYFLVGTSMRRASRELESSWTRTMTINSEYFDNFRQLASVRWRSLAVEEEFLSSRKRVALANARIANIAVLPRYVTELALMLGLGLLVIMRSVAPVNNQIPISIIAVFVAGAFRIVASMVSMQGALATLSHVRESGSKALVLLDTLDSSSSNGTFEIASLFDKSKEGFKLTNLGFRYEPNGQEILANVDLSISRGEFIAITGESGSGKSTLADLLLGLRNPTSGSVTYGNMDASLIRSGALAYVPQRTNLIAASLLENITLGGPSIKVDEKALTDAISIARLEEVIEGLPDGLQTLVGGNWRQLSGGQVQRVGLARAIYQRPEVLVLDEFTSALDAENEKLVTRAIEGLKGKVTLIVIAHRKQTVAAADRLIRVRRDGVAEAIEATL